MYIYIHTLHECMNLQIPQVFIDPPINDVEAKSPTRSFTQVSATTENLGNSGTPGSWKHGRNGRGWAALWLLEAQLNCRWVTVWSRFPNINEIRHRHHHWPRKGLLIGGLKHLYCPSLLGWYRHGRILKSNGKLQTTNRFSSLILLPGNTWSTCSLCSSRPEDGETWRGSDNCKNF